MKVRNLIFELSKCDPESVVWMDDGKKAQPTWGIAESDGNVIIEQPPSDVYYENQYDTPEPL